MLKYANTILSLFMHIYIARRHEIRVNSNEIVAFGTHHYALNTQFVFNTGNLIKLFAKNRHQNLIERLLVGRNTAGFDQIRCPISITVLTPTFA